MALVRISTLLTVMAVLAVAMPGCDDPGGVTPSAGDSSHPSTPTPQVEEMTTLRPPVDAADAPRDTEPLPPELAEIFRMIEQYRTGPARVRIVKYRKLHPDDGRAAFLFGLTYHREKRYRKALDHYERAIELAPGYSPTYHFLGWACYYLGRPDECRAAFERHLRYQPDVADSQFGLGLVDLEQDRLDDAERRFRSAIAWQEQAENARPRDVAKAYAQLGEVHARRDELTQARDTLEHAIALFPDHYEAYYRLSRVLVRLGDEDAARIALENHKTARQRVRPGTSFPE